MSDSNRGVGDTPVDDTPSPRYDYWPWRCKSLDAEIARLQRQIEGHCARIAAAHDVIARNAERSQSVPALQTALHRLLVYVEKPLVYHTPADDDPRACCLICAPGCAGCARNGEYEEVVRQARQLLPASQPANDLEPREQRSLAASIAIFDQMEGD